jgi:cobalamin biosynthesis protein CobT
MTSLTAGSCISDDEKADDGEVSSSVDAPRVKRRRVEEPEHDKKAIEKAVAASMEEDDDMPLGLLLGI